MINRQIIRRHHILDLILRYHIPVRRCPSLDNYLWIHRWRIEFQSGFKFRGKNCRCDGKTESAAEILEEDYEGLGDYYFGGGEVVLDGYYDLFVC